MLNRRSWGHRPLRSAVLSLCLGVAATLALRWTAFASVGQEGASFLQIPVGGRPAALGGAYSALAEDSYAPIWNPAGLGNIDAIHLSGMHLSYLTDVTYEHLGVAAPLTTGKALGLTAQYLRPGDVVGRDENGASLGTISGHYGAYTVAYGQRVTPTLSLGLSGRIIEATLSDVSAHAFAGDAGLLWRPRSALHVAATVTNAGNRLSFISQKDSLPLSGHLSGAFDLSRYVLWAVEGEFDKTGGKSFHTGVEWHPVSLLDLRAGYRTDTVQGLSALSGVTAGLGLKLWGQELNYAWVPMGDLGNTQYISFALRFDGAPKDRKNFVQLPRSGRPVHKHEATAEDVEPSLLDLDPDSNVAHQGVSQ